MSGENRSRIATFFVTYLLWVLATGFDKEHLITGIIVCAFIAITMGGIFATRGEKLRDIKRYVWFLWFLVVFIWECVKANIEVATIVIHPKLPIRPGIVKIKTALKNDTAITFLANFITLTPGTFTVDVDKENGFLYIHWINVKTEDVDEATKMISSKFEKIIMEVFE